MADGRRVDREAAERIGRNVFLARRRAGFSQEELGVLADLHRTEIGMVEKGERLPRVDTLLKLAFSLDVPMGEPGGRDRVDDRRAQRFGHLLRRRGLRTMGDAKVKVGVKSAEGRMLFLLQHPLRKRLLGLYAESDEPLSPKELADYIKAPLDHVACHVRVLRDHHAVELVEVRPARGAVEHFYRSTSLVDEVPWARVVLGLKEAA